MDIRNSLSQRDVNDYHDVNKTLELRLFRNIYHPKNLMGRRRKNIAVANMAYFAFTHLDIYGKMNFREIYLISLLKDNLTVNSTEPLIFDQGHACNDGIEGDSRISLTLGDHFQRTKYIDPETNIKKCFHSLRGLL